MELYSIFSKLKQDIDYNMHPDIYYKNQEDDINVMNTHKKKGWRHCLDAYQIIMHGQTYTGSYRFDKGKSFFAYGNPIMFKSFSDNSGLDFNDFITSVLNADPKIFVHVNGLEIYDLRKKLFSMKEIEIRNTNIDNLLITLIKKYFPKLEKIDFKNCILKKECDFSKFKIEINFSKCNIENFRIFNDTEAELIFFGSIISKISNATVNSKAIDFISINDMFYDELFLKCSFPNLESLKIEPDKNHFGISYKNQFKYLSKSAPMLENFYLEGKLSSFDFIIDMKNMLRCKIESIEDVHGLHYPDLDNKAEREKIKIRNIDAYNINKLLNPDEEDKYLIGSLELNRIISLAHFNKLLNFTNEEYEFLKNNPNLIEYLKNKKIVNGEITKFYELYYDTLILKNTSNDKRVILGLEKNHMFLDGFMYNYRNDLLMNNSSQKIVKAFPFIYNYDLKPIVFMNRKKEITTAKEAYKFLEKNPYRKGWDYDDLYEYEYNEFVETVKSWRNIEYELSIGELIDGIYEVTSISVKPKHFMNFGEGGRYIAGLLESFNRSHDIYETLCEKNLYYRKLLEKLIIDNYEKFTIEEKQLLLIEIQKYLIQNIYINFSSLEIKQIFQTLEDNDCYNKLLKSINLKTDGLYNKYFNMIKLTYNQSQIQEKPYYKIIKKDYMKKLDLK